MENWSLDKRSAFPHIRTWSQKVRLKSHAPTGLPINAYDPRRVLYSDVTAAIQFDLHGRW